MAVKPAPHAHLVRRLIGTRGSKKATPVFIVAFEKYGKPQPKGKS